MTTLINEVQFIDMEKKTANVFLQNPSFHDRGKEENQVGSD